MKRKKIIVIGGGASGLLAAGTAAESGADVLLLEKMKSPARKIRISGKGRCNLTNSADLAGFLTHFGKSGRFLRQAFERYFSPELVAFFESRGFKLTEERGGRIFPAQADAPAVAGFLLEWIAEAGVDIKTDHSVTGLLVEEGRVTGVLCNGRKIYGDSVIIATGGSSYPRTGSTGDGYKLARAAGHSLVPIRPALVPVETEKSAIKGLAGLDLRNINARLYINGKRKKQVFGELSFTANGLSGPIILTLSLTIVDAIREKKKVMISLDLKPALDDTKLEARLLRDLEKRVHEPMTSVLRGLVPRELVATCLVNTGIDSEETAGNLSARARKKLRLWLKDFRIKITGYRSYNEAIITAGGVKTTEVDPRTMESRKINSLYIVGELLDIQADTGGYNFQAAFSTGWIAGKAASRLQPAIRAQPKQAAPG